MTMMLLLYHICLMRQGLVFVLFTEECLLCVWVKCLCLCVLVAQREMLTDAQKTLLLLLLLGLGSTMLTLKSRSISSHRVHKRAWHQRRTDMEL